MTLKKRPRACNACHSIKIKCELGSDGGDPPCERCVRLGKDCVVSQPKRQKDRVAELEAQVEALTRLLDSQKIQGSDTDAAPIPNTPSKKRRLSDADTVKPDVDEEQETNAFPMDRVLTRSKQMEIFERHVKEIMPRFTLVPLAETCTYEGLRKDKPLLLQAIIYGSCHGLLSADAQEEVAKVVFDLIGPTALSKTEKSVELVQAIQSIHLWFRFPKFHTKTALLQLTPLAFTIAKDIGLSSQEGRSSVDYSSLVAHVDAAECWRTWLVCYLLSASMSNNLGRRPNPLNWGAHEDTAILMLEYWPHGVTNDRLVAQYVRAERLCERIAILSRFSDFSTITDVASPATQATINSCSSLIADWKAQIPPHIDCPTLKIWERLAMMYTHECVLHTATNKHSFTGPYAAERLSLADFPAPVVAQEHITALFALRENSQALLDLYSEFDMSMLMALPPILFASRAAYSQWILMKLYIATSARGNTFGDFVDPQSIRIDDYLQKLISVSERVFKVDTRCGMARISESTYRMKEWLSNYRASLSVDTLPAAFDGNNGIAFDQKDFNIDWDFLATGEDAFDYNLESFFEKPI